MSPDVELLLSPRRVYAALASEAPPAGAIAWLRRPAVAALALGVSVAISSTGHVTLPLVLSTTLCWAYVILIQIGIALAVTAPRARRTVGVRRGLDLFFASHVPWSATLLLLAGWGAVTSPIGRSSMVLLTALVPAALTSRIIRGFFEEVLRMDRRGATRLTVVHQAITWLVLLAIYGEAVQVWPRAVGVFR